VVIDCGMQELMNDAELRSLVTQVQCSYAGVLNLTIDAVLEASSGAPHGRTETVIERRAGLDSGEHAGSHFEQISKGDGDATARAEVDGGADEKDVARNHCGDGGGGHEHGGQKAAESIRDDTITARTASCVGVVHRRGLGHDGEELENADVPFPASTLPISLNVGHNINTDKSATPSMMSSKERKRADAIKAIIAAGAQGKPLRLMLSSLAGRFKEALGRDEGSVRWPLTTSPEPFALAALTAAATATCVPVVYAPAHPLAGAAAADSPAIVQDSPSLARPPISLAPVAAITPEAGGGHQSMVRQRQRIIVLSPDAREAITEAPSRDDIFIIGGLCDYKRVVNATLDRAEAAGVEARRLPIEEVLGPVSVNILTVNQTVEALCRASISGGDWAAALAAVLPARKLEDMEEQTRQKHKGKGKTAAHLAALTTAKMAVDEDVEEAAGADSK